MVQGKSGFRLRGGGGGDRAPKNGEKGSMDTISICYYEFWRKAPKFSFLH